MKTSTVAVASMMLMGAALAQADFVTLEAAASRTHTYLYKIVENTESKEVNVELRNPGETTPNNTGGETAMHTMITADLDANVAYIKSLLAPLNNKYLEDRGDRSVDVYVYGTGGVRHAHKDDEMFWGNVKAAIETFANTDEGRKFKFVSAETRTGLHESQVALQTATRLTKNKNAVLAWVGATSLQIAYETDDEYLARSYPVLGSVQASKDYTEKLAGPEYAEATAKEIELEKGLYRPTSLFALFNDDKVTPVLEKKHMVEQLERGRLSEYQGMIDHPCLMKVETKEEALKMVEFFSAKKSNPTTYREIGPFKGTGDYEKCFQSIAKMIDETVTPVKFDASKTAPVVGMGTLYYNTFNLVNFEIIVKNGLKTVGDLVEASKKACSITFKDALTRFNKLGAEVKEWNNDAEKVEKFGKKSTVSPHGLTELCWASTYSTVVLKHTLGLDDSQLLVTGRGDVGKEAALNIARSKVAHDEL